MSPVRIKMGICEYYFEYETLEDIKKHFRKNGLPYIGLDSVDNYDSHSRGERISIDELTLEHVEWAKEHCKWGDRYLRAWGNK